MTGGEERGGGVSVSEEAQANVSLRTDEMFGELCATVNFVDPYRLTGQFP